nr:insulinase family protein [Lentilactobacillus kefiri]
MGTPKETKAITSPKLYEFYGQVLSQSKISILVGGDLDENVVVNGFKKFRSFVDRTPDTFDLKVVPDNVEKVQRGTKNIAGSQSVLSIAYRLPIYFGDAQYFPAVIFNQLFGGSSRSLLFTNVREKNSMAYDIHSSYNSLVGMASVQAGIDYKNEERVTEMVAEQLKQMIDGHYSDELLEGVKQALINQHRSEADHLSALIEKQYVQQIMGFSLSDADWESQVEAVNREQISEVAKQMSLRAVYQLNSRGQS